MESETGFRPVLFPGPVLPGDASPGDQHRDDPVGVNVRRGMQSEGDDPALPVPSGIPEEGIILVYDHRPRRRQLPEQVSFLRRHPGQVRESRQMGQADIGDQADVRQGHPGQSGDLPRGVRPQLQDSRHVAGPQAEQRQRQTDEIVEVAFRFQNVSPPSHDGGDHLLGCGLAGAAGNGDDRGGEAPPPPGGQITQCPQGIADDDHGELAGETLRPTVDEGSGGPLPPGLRQVVVAVEMLPRQGDEQVAFPTLSGVRAYPPENYFPRSGSGQKLAAGGRQDLGE